MVPRVEMIAHRGSGHLVPENTLAAFSVGWQETTTCELDVRLTGDDKVVVIHDDSTKRTTGADLKVAEHSLGELQKLDAGSWKGERWRGEHLPSLGEVIAAMPAEKKILIEVKVGLEIFPELTRVIRASGKAKQLIVQSFFPWVCAEAKRVLAGVPVYLLIACSQDAEKKSWAPTIDESIREARKHSLQGISANNTPLIDASAIESVHSAGLKLNIWTVDEVAEARRLAALGVDAIITNRPAWLMAQLDQGA